MITLAKPNLLGWGWVDRIALLYCIAGRIDNSVRWSDCYLL